MRFAQVLRVLWPFAMAAPMVACGFDPRPPSGVVACAPQGSGCCPDGYICVGRGTDTDAGISPGTCWYKEDLPLEALALTHDHTPGRLTDPACVVTDWPTIRTGTGEGEDAGEPADVPEAEDAAVDVESEALAGSFDGTADGTAALDGAVVDVAASEASSSLDLGAPPEVGSVDQGTSSVTITGISAGGSHVCAVVNGGVRCWGNNESGQLGDGTVSDSLAPVRVVDLQGVTVVKTGIFRTCAVVDGGARCWGTDGECSELAARKLPLRLQTAPVPVLGLDSGVTDIAIGLKHTCAVVNGAALCWGSNLNSQLGDESSKGKCMGSPVQVAGLTSGVTAIVAGNAHSCALVNGGVHCWGSNDSGQLGDNSTTERTVPVQVVGLETGVTALAAGYAFTCAVVNGGAQCWGENSLGELGDGTATSRLAPVPVVSLALNVTAIAAGSHLGCAVVGGAARCWGMDPYGSAFIPDNALQPIRIYGVEAGVRSIAAGFFTCALVGDGVKCWGKGNLGDGAATNRGLPVDVVFP